MCGGDGEAVVMWVGGGCAGFASVVPVFSAASCEVGGTGFKLDVADRGVGPWGGLVLLGISKFGWKAGEASLGSWTTRLV